MWLCLLSSQILLKLNRGTLKLSKWMCLFVLCLQCSHQTFQLIVKLAVSALLKFNLEKKPNKRWNFWNILTEDQVDLRWSKSPRQNLLMIIKSWRNGHWTFLLSMWLFTISKRMIQNRTMLIFWMEIWSVNFPFIVLLSLNIFHYINTAYTRIWSIRRNFLFDSAFVVLCAVQSTFSPLLQSFSSISHHLNYFDPKNQKISVLTWLWEGIWFPISLFGSCCFEM